MIRYEHCDSCGAMVTFKELEGHGNRKTEWHFHFYVVNDHSGMLWGRIVCAKCLKLDLDGQPELRQHLVSATRSILDGFGATEKAINKNLSGEALYLLEQDTSEQIGFYYRAQRSSGKMLPVWERMNERVNEAIIRLEAWANACGDTIALGREYDESKRREWVRTAMRHRGEEEATCYSYRDVGDDHI